MTQQPQAKRTRPLLALGTIALLFACQPAWSAAADQERSDRYYRDAKQYLENRDYNAAIIQLKNALQEDTNNVAARKMLGKLYLDLGNAPSAAKEIRAAMRRGAQDQDLSVLLARAYLMLGKFADANQLMSGFEPDGQHKHDAALIRGRAYLGLKRYGDASKAFAHADKLRPDDIRAKIGITQGLINQGKIDEAEKQIDIALARDPGAPAALALKGELRRLNRDLSGAVAHFDKALAADTRNVLARLGRSATLIDLNRDEEAAKDIDAIFQRVPGHPLATYLNALVMAKKKDYVGALEALESVGDALDDHMPSVFLRGASHYAVGQTEQAVKALTHYITRVPQNVRGRKLLGAALIRQREPARAIEVLEPIDNPNSKDARLLTLLGSAHMQIGKYNAGTEYFSRAVAAAPDTADIRTKLALGSLALGHHETAIGELEKAIDLDPDARQASVLLPLIKLRRGDYDGALAAARALAKRKPDNPVAQNLIGAALLGKGDLEGARATFKSALERHPDFHAARMNLGQLALRAGDPETARGHYRQVLKKDAKHIGAMMAMAAIGAKTENRPEVEEWLKKAIEANPQALAPRLQLVQHYTKSSEFRRALQIAREMNQNIPNNLRALEILGRAETAAGEPISAVETFRRVVGLSPKSARAHGMLAGARMAANDFKSARKDLAAAIAVDPNYVPARIAMVELAVREGHMKEAMKLAQDIRTKFAKSPAGDLLIGDIKVRLRKFDEAIAAYEAGMKKSNNAMLALRRFQARRRAGDVDRALAELRDWVEKKDDRAARHVLASAYISAGRYDEAIRQSEKLLVMEKNNPVLLNNLAWLYQMRNDPRAVAFAERALARAPRSAAVMDTLGWILVNQGKLRRAVSLLRRASVLAPSQGDIRYHLAVALHRRGETLEARTALERLLDSGLAFTEKTSAQELLKKLRPRR